LGIQPSPFGDARQSVFVVAAIPERDAPRSRARVDAGVVDGVVLALEGHVRLRPERLHDLRLFLRPAATVVEILVQGGEFNLVPADADAQAEAAAGQHVEAGRLLRDQRGLALGDDQHAGGEGQFRRDGGQIAKQNERIMEHVVGDGAARVGAGVRSGIGAQHVVRRFEEIVAQGFEILGEVTHQGGIAAGVGERNERTKLHGRGPLWW
jgi:hypothetical protein